MPRLENWGVVRDDRDPYKAPEQRRWYLVGEVYDHPKIPDGHHIHTSVLVGISIVEGSPIMATTYSGSSYILGTPDPKYLEVLKKDGKTFDESMSILQKLAAQQKRIVLGDN